MKKIDTNSNAYTIVYAAVMVVIVAFMLAFVSLVLQDKQEANVKNDTKGQILASLNMDRSKIDVENTFSEIITDHVWNGKELVKYDGPFLSTYGKSIKNKEFHVFVAQTEEGVKYVIPVIGRGLWGGLWGYVSLNEDKKTIYGTYFYHESETAGLGSRIADRDFQEKFNNKPLFDGDTSSISLSVVKSGTVSSTNEIDGITGATLTTIGVNDMIQEGLAPYLGFINGESTIQ